MFRIFPTNKESEESTQSETYQEFLGNLMSYAAGSGRIEAASARRPRSRDWNGAKPNEPSCLSQLLIFF